MKAKNMIIGAIAALGLTTATSSAQQINPITKAMLDGYDEVLKNDPKDYFTLYQRGAQYYQLSLYDQALNDLQKALSLTPEKERDMINREYSLLSDICIETKDYDKALEYVEKALALEPDSYSDLYKKGNICLYLGRGEDAYNAFKSMRRLKSRSQEASFGMARAAIMMGREEEARGLMEEAQEADPSNYLTFCRIGDLKRELGDNASAAADYLSAFSLASDTSRPLESLVNLAFADYPAFDTAINYALSRTENKVPLYFLKGNIALSSGNYNEARESLGELLKNPEAQEGDVYAQMARACLALDDLEAAQTNIDLALMKSKTAPNYTTKSQIELAKGNQAAALLAARNAAKADPQDNEALAALALAAAANGDAKEAQNALSEAIINDPSDLNALMLRAWVNTEVAKDAKAGQADYSRAAAATADAFPEIAWKALAQSKAGKKLDADSTIEKGLKEHNSKNDFYYAAVYYAQTGNLEKSAEMLQNARNAGFQNIHLLMSDNTADLNLAPVRHLLK